MNLPKIPNCKKYNGNMTPEQEVLMKIQLNKNITQEDVDILDEAFEFYKTAFSALKKINLSLIIHEEANVLKEYLKNVLNLELVFQNSIIISSFFRMTWVADYNENEGKVRESKYLSYTPLDIVKLNKRLGRANTNESTCLYLAENPQVAVFECKPSLGDRIIITEWTSVDKKPFVMYPISALNEANIEFHKAINALDKKLEESNQYFARIIKVIQNFLGSEFVKDVKIENEFAYEYIFSAYFSDKILNSNLKNHEDDDFEQYDGIFYPSIATKFKFANIAVRQTSVPKLKPIYSNEYLVNKTNYDTFDWGYNNLPFEGDLIRQSVSIGDIIKWNDD